MSYFPTDIPFMSDDELKENGIKLSHKKPEIIKGTDLVPVIRCKDCKHWQHGMIGMGCYWDADYPHEENDFCSHGERKE